MLGEQLCQPVDLVHPPDETGERRWEAPRSDYGRRPAASAQTARAHQPRSQLTISDGPLDYARATRCRAPVAQASGKSAEPAQRAAELAQRRRTNDPIHR